MIHLRGRGRRHLLSKLMVWAQGEGQDKYMKEGQGEEPRMWSSQYLT
jgi:hypothetical protein